VDRRGFLGGLTVTASIVGAGTFIAEEAKIRDVRAHGRAVAYHPAPGPTATTLLWRVDTAEKIAALTFDDGPDPRYTPGVLEILQARGAMATFFMQGSHVDAHPDLAKAVAARHVVGNHTYTHPDMGNAPASEASRELQRAQDAIGQAIDEVPNLFRPPYGRFSGATSMIAARMGFDIILWSDRIDSHAAPSHNVQRLKGAFREGDILLGHDGGSLPNQAVVDSLGGILDNLDRHGIRTVTIPELMATARIEPVRPQPAPFDETETEPPELATGLRRADP
jgi:peptidoglycan/xylan/chitin deacetylase (PgdA/CDA1 family)